MTEPPPPTPTSFHEPDKKTRVTVTTSPRKVYPLPKKVSNQIHVLQRLLDLGSNHPKAIGFTVDDILRWPNFKPQTTKRNSIRVALIRFRKLGIVFSPGVDSSGRPLFKVKNAEWAMSYIVGDHTKPWLSLTPTPSTDQFFDFGEHRDHFDVQLTKEWFERIKDKSEAKNNQYTLRNKRFTLSVNGKSYVGQIFIKPSWRTEIKRQIGDDFYQYLADKESKGALQGDLCLPIGLMGQRLTIGGRPAQFSASHYPAQLDIRRSKNDSNLFDGLMALVSQADFYTRILDSQDAIHKVLEKHGETFQKLFRILFPESDQSYQSSSQDRGDFAYR
jgi:hypothetical protein